MTCPVIPDKPNDPKPFFNNGNIDFKAHDVGWLVCGIMALIATISSAWLIWKHLTYYTCPQQQRHIVRLLIMVPIYAIVSFMSYLFYEQALYYQTIRDCYEAVLVTSFFYLILAYTGDTRAEQHAVFRNLELKDRFWVWPLGSWKYKPDGLHFLWLMKICVLQYAIVRPLCTFIAVGTEYFGYYCLHSWMPWFTHVWCAFFISISVTVAMYCLIQLYMPIKRLVDPYRPLLKFLSIKTIVFLTFWQDVMLSFLVSFGAIKETEYFTAEQIQAGINALLQCFWMLLFGFIHIKAFSYLPYRPEDRSRTTRRGRALLDALDFRDWFFEMKESTRYMAARSKGRDYTLVEDLRAKRHEHLLNAFGKSRTANLETEIDMEKAAMPTFWKNPEDAQSWTPASEIANSEPGNRKEMDDAYTSLPLSASRSGARNGVKHQPAPACDSHTQRAAELQRLVQELDLQVVDQSIIGADDTDYGYEDERYERTGLMRQHAKQVAADKSQNDDQHPELTQYHVPTFQLANVPSLAYEQDTLPSGVANTGGLHAGAEADESLMHSRQRSKAEAGIGAFGIASWFGWNGNGATHEQANASSGADAYLRPSDAYGADAAPRPADAQGTGWWRNYWEQVSNVGSREPSVVGMEEDEEKEPLNESRPAVLRQVTAGSWGTESGPQSIHRTTAAVGSHSPPTPPALTINTRSHANYEASMDSASSPSSGFTPHADSPLSRLIQTSRDSFSSLSREEVRKQLLESSSPRGQRSAVSGLPSSLPSSTIRAVRPTPAPRMSSFAASSKQATVSRVTSTTTQPEAVRKPKSVPSVYEPAAGQLASEMLSANDSTGGRHPIVFADALVEKPAVEEADDQVVKAKALAPAVGPKGKLVNIVLPSPLSPARYPYGKEARQDAPAGSKPAAIGAKTDCATEATGDTEPRALKHQHQSSASGGGTLKWASQPARSSKSSAEPSSVDTITKLPQGKNMITVGSMSLVQAKAAQEKAATDAAFAKSALRPSTVVPSPLPTSSIKSLQPKSILVDSNSSKAPAKPLLPAPSRLPNVEMIGGDDPYVAGRSATINTPAERRRVSAPIRGSVVASSSAQTRTSMSTAFEVGSIVPREAVVRASMPAGGPLRGYYDSIGRSSQHGEMMQRHSFVPAVNGPRPAMLPAHPSQIRGNGGANARPGSGFHPHPQQAYRPPPPPPGYHQQQVQPSYRHPYQYPRQMQTTYPQQPPSQQPRYPQLQPQQQYPHPSSQFQFEYYRD
ncbi:putative Transmembrane protein 184-like protein (putative) [Pseudozyma hubeiensis]|nr:putative Transmembrane protein 184-like protein (putative) [Pseudozyma hubeiensis]